MSLADRCTAQLQRADKTRRYLLSMPRTDYSLWPLLTPSWATHSSRVVSSPRPSTSCERASSSHQRRPPHTCTLLRSCLHARPSLYCTRRSGSRRALEPPTSRWLQHCGAAAISRPRKRQRRRPPHSHLRTIGCALTGGTGKRTGAAPHSASTASAMRRRSPIRLVADGSASSLPHRSRWHALAWRRARGRL